MGFGHGAVSIVTLILVVASFSYLSRSGIDQPEAESGAAPTTPAAYGQPQYAQPQYAQPQYGQPQQYGDPRQGQPQYGQPQYGDPRYPDPRQGDPRYAADPRYRNPQ
jgi:hypothetical protein